MLGSSVRASARAAVYVALTLPLMPVQAMALVLRSRLAEWLPRFYHGLCCRVLGIRVIVRGPMSAERPTLFVANHLSYLDIAVLSSVIAGSFVAKREVAGWPLFGWLAKLQRTVFIGRRPAGVVGERDDIARRLAEGSNLILFAEGTSGDGTRLLPFKSSLFAAAHQSVAGRPIAVQPVSLAYTRLDGMPIGRAWRPYFTWYGDMGMLPHLWQAIGAGHLTVEIEFHRPVTIAGFASRKALAVHCEREIGAGLAAANRGGVSARASRGASAGATPGPGTTAGAAGAGGRAPSPAMTGLP